MTTRTRFVPILHRFTMLAAIILLSLPGVAAAQAVDRLVVAVGADEPTQDPQARGTLTHTAAQLFDTLVRLDPETMEIVPHLATSWEIDEDGSWIFALREDVFFHNGEPFNAESVAFTFDRVMNYTAGAYLDAVSGVEIIDDYTVRILTYEPYPALLGPLNLTSIIPAGYVTEFGGDHFANNPVGTGPFRFKEWHRDLRLVLERNDDYWGELAQVAEIEFRVVPDQTAALAGLLANEIDIVVNLDPVNEPLLEGSGHRVVSGEALRYFYMFLRGDQGGPLADARVRQAINYAVDVETIVETIYYGRGSVMTTVSHPGIVGHNGDVEPYTYDPERAAELLAEAGYPGGSGLPVLELQTREGFRPFDRELAEVVAEYLLDVGIPVEINILEHGYASDIFQNRGIGDIFATSVTTARLDVETMFARLRTNHQHNYVNLDDYELDALIDAAQSELDPVRRQELNDELHQVWRDLAPYLLLHQFHDIYGVHRRVGGFEGIPWELPRFGGVYIRSE